MTEPRFDSPYTLADASLNAPAAAQSESPALINKIDWPSALAAKRPFDISSPIGEVIISDLSEHASPSTDTLPPATAHADGKAWTYMVNLTANVDKGDHVEGSLAVFDQLQKLQKQTAGAQSQLMVQITDANTRSVSVYKIADGKMTALGSAAMKSYGQDVERFVAMAPTDGKLAFIDLGHGAAGSIAGDVPGYRASLDELIDHMQGGLKQTGRNNFDAVSLDACDMANPNVVAQSAKVTANLVASEVIEWKNGQNLQDTLANALTTPPVDGKEFGRSLVSHSAADCRTTSDPEEACGTETVTLFDTTKAVVLQSSLSDLGTVLAQSIEDPLNKKTIQEIINKLPDTGVNESQNFYEFSELRDLHSFGDSLLKAIKEGSLQDKDHSIEKATRVVFAAQEGVIDTNYSRLPQWQGLNVVLPSPKNDPETVFDGVVQHVTEISRDFDALANKLAGDSPPSVQDVRAALLKEQAEMMEKDKLDPASNTRPTSILWDYQSAIKEIAFKPQISAADVAGLAVFGQQARRTLESQRSNWLAEKTPIANAFMKHVLEHQMSGHGGWNDFVTKFSIRPDAAQK